MGVLNFIKHGVHPIRTSGKAIHSFRSTHNTLCCQNQSSNHTTLCSNAVTPKEIFFLNCHLVLSFSAEQYLELIHIGRTWKHSHRVMTDFCNCCSCCCRYRRAYISCARASSSAWIIRASSSLQVKREVSHRQPSNRRELIGSMLTLQDQLAPAAQQPPPHRPALPSAQAPHQQSLLQPEPIS